MLSKAFGLPAQARPNGLGSPGDTGEERLGTGRWLASVRGAETRPGARQRASTEGWPVMGRRPANS